MNPRYHLSPALLIGYAAGASSDAESLVVATHLTLCSACRAAVAAQEQVAGACLEAQPGGDLPADLLAATLAKLDAPPSSQPGLPGREPFASTSRLQAPDADAPIRTRSDQVWGGAPLGLALPRVLAARLALAAPGFRFLAPGIKGIDLPTSSRRVRLRLMRLSGGVTVPPHDHGAPEYTLVLSGAFEDDASRRFGAGDLCIREAGESHRQHVERGQPCIALQLNEGPLLPLTFKGKVLSALFDQPWSSGGDRL